MSCFPLLSTLTLKAPVTSDHMSSILAALPQLTDLTLRHCSKLQSLSFISSVDWNQRIALQHLTIINWSRPSSMLPVDTLSDLSCLCGLASLTLDSAFTHPLDETTLRRLRPPSELFPLLTQFCYEHTVFDQ